MVDKELIRIPTMSSNLNPEWHVEEQTLREAPPSSYANRFQYKCVMGASEIVEEMQEPPPPYGRRLQEDRKLVQKMI